jgi:predicted dehydrogenase
MKEVLRVGLIGCGMISTTHMQVYSILKNDIEVVAVCDPNLDRANCLAKRYGISTTFASYEDMLDKVRPDFVDICTPTPTHSRIALDSARSGCNILVEKPMARSSEECQTMIEEAERNRVSLCVCHNRLFSPSLIKAREILGENDRRISLCTVRLKVRRGVEESWKRETGGGGALWETGTHPAYLQRCLLGDIDSVFAMCNLVTGPMPDNFFILLHSRSGAIGLVDLSWWQTPAHVFQCQIETEAGEQIELDLNSEYFDIKKAIDRNRIAVDLAAKVINDLKKSYKARISLAAKYALRGVRFIRRTHLALISQFVESLNNHTAPPVTGQDGLETIRILHAVEASIEKGTAVTVQSKTL